MLSSDSQLPKCSDLRNPFAVFMSARSIQIHRNICIQETLIANTHCTIYSLTRQENPPRPLYHFFSPTNSTISLHTRHTTMSNNCFQKQPLFLLVQLKCLIIKLIVSLWTLIAFKHKLSKLRLKLVQFVICLKDTTHLISF
jgi:hypothetical protein